MHFLISRTQQSYRTIEPLPQPKVLFIFFVLYMYELYSVCASLLCDIQKIKQKKKENKSITERIRNSMLVEF